MLYDRGETEAALHHLERTEPDDHFDELGLWRYIELKKTVYRLPDDDPELAPWHARLGEVAGEPDSIDMLLAEIEAQQPDGTVRDPHQLELFGTLLTELQAMQKRPGSASRITWRRCPGILFRGTWEEILLQMKAAEPRVGRRLDERVHGEPRPPRPDRDRHRHPASPTPKPSSAAVPKRASCASSSRRVSRAR